MLKLLIFMTRLKIVNFKELEKKKIGPVTSKKPFSINNSNLKEIILNNVINLEKKISKYKLL